MSCIIGCIIVEPPNNDDKLINYIQMIICVVWKVFISGLWSHGNACSNNLNIITFLIILYHAKRIILIWNYVICNWHTSKLGSNELSINKFIWTYLVWYIKWFYLNVNTLKYDLWDCNFQSKSGFYNRNM